MTDHNARGQKVARRIRTIPVVVLLALAVTIVSPVVITVTLAVDAVRWLVTRKPWMATRMFVFGWFYLLVEVSGVVGLFAVWVGTGFGLAHRAMIDATYAVQERWAAALVGGVRLIFSVTFEIENDDVIVPGPLLVFARHASIVDNLLPAQFVSVTHGIHLRYVLKKELLSDPCLDIAGNRLPNHFVDRSSANPRKELEAIRALTDGLDERNGVLLFPEGTRFTEKRRARALDDMSDGDPALFLRAQELRNVLPPKMGGASTLLKAAPQTDVLILAHRGLEGLARAGDVWSGALVGLVVRVRFWRIPAGEIPTDRAGRTSWLFDQWEAIDQWIESGKEPAIG